MHVFRPGLAGAVSLAASAALISDAQVPFKSGVDTVAVYATVQGRDGRLVPQLAREDFRVLEDGRPADVVLFSNDPQPISVAVMISGALLDNGLGRVRASVRALLERLTPDDRAAVGTIGPEIAVSALLPPSHPELRRVLVEELWWGPYGPLWLGLDRAMSAVGRESGRRVVLVLTDDVGRDVCPLPLMGAACGSLEAAASRAESDNVLVYGINFGGAMSEPRPDELKRLRTRPNLKDLVNETGGASVVVSDEDDVEAVFGRVADELHQQYLFAFRPRAFDGKRHAIRVEATRPGLTVRTRKTYLAPRRS